MKCKLEERKEEEEEFFKIKKESRYNDGISAQSLRKNPKNWHTAQDRATQQDHEFGSRNEKKNLYAYAMELISHGDLIVVVNDCLFGLQRNTCENRNNFISVSKIKL